jgi:hypothetical protein
MLLHAFFQERTEGSSCTVCNKGILVEFWRDDRWENVSLISTSKRTVVVLYCTFEIVASSKTHTIIYWRMGPRPAAASKQPNMREDLYVSLAISSILWRCNSEL